MAQQMKDLALSLLWHGFDPWPGNICALQVQSPSPIFFDCKKLKKHFF